MNYVLSYARLSLARLLQYRVNFFISAVANIVHYGTSLLLITILLDRFHSIDGWTRIQVIFLYAFALLSFSLFGLFFQQLSNFSNLVLQGQLDRMLLRPRMLFLQVVLDGINPVYFSHFLFSLSLFAYVTTSGEISLSGADFIVLGLAVLAGILIQISVALIASTISFFTLESGSIFYLLIYAPRELIWYPIGIYPAIVQGFVTFVVPFAFINFFPVRTVLDVRDSVLLSDAMGWASIPVALLALLLAGLAWRYGVSRYASSGS